MMPQRRKTHEQTTGPDRRYVHVCAVRTQPGGPVPGVSPLTSPGATTVLVGGMLAARAGDVHFGIGAHPVAMGSMTVFIQNQPAARIACSVRWIWGPASTWAVRTSAPASAKAWI